MYWTPTLVLLLTSTEWSIYNEGMMRKYYRWIMRHSWIQRAIWMMIHHWRNLSSIRSVLDGSGVMLAPRNGNCWFVVYAQKSLSLWSGCFLCFKSIYGCWCLMLSSFIIVSFWLLDMLSCWGTSSFISFKTWVWVQRAHNWFGSFERSHIPLFFFFAIWFRSHMRICWVVDEVCLC